MFSRAFYVPWCALAAALGLALTVGTCGRQVGADDAPSETGDETAAVAGHVAEPEDDHTEASSERETPTGHQANAESGDQPHGAETDAHDDGAHHDPYDLSHANASAKLEDPTEWRYDMAVCTFVVFLILLILLRIFAWGPIMSGLQRRETAIAARIEEADRNAEESAAQLRAYQDKMAASAQEAQEIIAQARRDAEAAADKILAEAQKDAERERQRAMADIQDAKNAALRDVAEKGADMAVLLAGRIVRRELKPQDHTELISEALGKFPSNN